MGYLLFGANSFLGPYWGSIGTVLGFRLGLIREFSELIYTDNFPQLGFFSFFFIKFQDFFSSFLRLFFSNEDFPFLGGGSGGVYKTHALTTYLSYILHVH